MSQKDNIHDSDLEKEAPILFSIPKKKHTAPEGYFESLADRVMERKRKLPAETKPIQTLTWMKWAVAAGVAVLMGLFLVEWNGHSEITDAEAIARSVEVDLVEDMDYLLAIDEDIVMEIYLEDPSEESENDEIDFLMDEGVEYEELLNTDI
ncbi:MAG: hypothetical protein HKN79_10245 [Flavobacteriales bacterium]|nr:hypothetical protein [Flavobacteriales bacterium]